MPTGGSQADQFAICENDRGVEVGPTEKQLQLKPATYEF